MDSNRKINIDQILKTLLKQQSTTQKSFCLTQDEVAGLCYHAKNLMMMQPMLLQLIPPLNICGDFHGQFLDLKQMFATVGLPKNGQNFLFLGDYVDRGKQSLQCICLLLALKIKHPDNFFLLRGNHECSELNKIYGFYDQCKRKIGMKICKNFSSCFNCMPVAAVVGNRIFCVHGGLSPYLSDLSELNQIKRPYQFEKGSIVSDILWSDPSLMDGWSQNIQRGTSYYFGADIVKKFLKKHDFDLICRSHQVVQDGYEFFANQCLITIFSAPNYCNMFQNKGAVLVINKKMSCFIKQFHKQTPFKYQMKRSTTPSHLNNKQNKLTESQNKRNSRKTIGSSGHNSKILKTLLMRQI